MNGVRNRKGYYSISYISSITLDVHVFKAVLTIMCRIKTYAWQGIMENK